MPVSGKEREGRVPAEWEDPSDESPAFGRAARWGSPSSLLNALACLLIPKCKAWLPHHCLNVCAECLHVCVCMCVEGGNPVVQLHFFHHNEDTRVKMEAWWPSLLKRSQGVSPGPNLPRCPQPPPAFFSPHPWASKQKLYVWLWGIMKTKMWIVFCCSYWCLSSKPEVKNTLSLKNMTREGKKKSKRKKNKKHQLWICYQKKNYERAFPVQRTHIATIYFRTWNLSSKIIYYKNVYKIAAHSVKNITARYC